MLQVPYSPAHPEFLEQEAWGQGRHPHAMDAHVEAQEVFVCCEELDMSCISPHRVQVKRICSLLHFHIPIVLTVREVLLILVYLLENPYRSRHLK